MIGTSHRGPVQRSVFHCVRRRAPDCGAVHSQGAHTSRVRPPTPALLPSSHFTWAGWEVV
ncbi:unnamed protein product, partial [Staurois parvus]